MDIYILHAGLSHPSPYFYNLEKEIEKYEDINLIINGELPNYIPNKKSILYFNRLKRYYDSNDVESVNQFLNKVDELSGKGWIIAFTVHNFFPIDRDITEVDEYMFREFLKRTDIVFCFSEYMKDQLKNIYNIDAINHSIGYNQLDGWFDKECEEKISLNDNSFVFTFIGNVNKYKMLDKFIEAFNDLKKDNVYFVIAGPDSKNYSLKIDNKNIIRINHFIGDSEWDYLKSITNVFINSYDVDLPNFKYGFFPSNCVQINYNKKICIVPNSPIIKELLNEGTYFVYENNLNSIKSVLRYTYDNCELIKQMESKYSSKDYSWQKTVEVIVNAFRNFKINKIDYSILSRGTEKYTKTGYMAISQSENNMRCLCSLDHGVKYSIKYQYPLYFHDRYSISNIAISRFQLISELYLKDNEIKDSIGIIGIGSVGFGLLINLLDRGYKNINIYIKDNKYIENKIGILNKYYNVNVKIHYTLDDLDKNINIFECVGSTSIIKDILNNITYNKNILLLGTPRDNEYVIDFLDIHRRNLSIVGIHEINGVCQEAREVLFNKILERNIRKEKILDEFVTVYNEYKDNDNKNNFIEIYKE